MSSKFQKLLGKHVLIIGGTSGIGYGVAEACLASGAQVTISSSSLTRVTDKVKQLQESYPSSTVSGYACDLSKPTLEADLTQLFEQVVSSRGNKLDHIVFTACDQLELIPWRDISLDFFRSAGQMRLFAQFFVGKIGSRYLNPGPESSIVLTTGTSSEKPIPGWAMVASYAAGLKGLTRNLALDLRPIRVNIVSPGFVETELWQNMEAEKREPLFDWVRNTMPTAKVGTPEEVAEAYLWLMKDTNVTGSVACTNAGMKLV
ncbi:hypothetical protein VTN77DRAFT_7888 [Rasamsonia byssochlamydoides]|uniref:uncharacterized protein n=1 Tax=Rasamsonia byssochlamydoides TaxID=89139 RepID=UPI003742A227